MNTLQTLILLAAGLSAVKSSGVQSKSLLQFRSMILCEKPDSAPVIDYADYGCYCGKGGSGTPVDDLDRCCFVHDNCYGDAMELPDCPKIFGNPYTNFYHYSCDKENKINCGDKNSACEKFICECDRKAAECFAGSKYNDENKHRPKKLCQ